MFQDISTTHLARKDEDRMIIINNYEQLLALLADFSITEPRKKLILLQLPNLTEEENISCGEALNKQYHAYGYSEAIIAGISGALLSVPLVFTDWIQRQVTGDPWKIFLSFLIIISSTIAGKLYGLGKAKQTLYCMILDLKYKGRSRHELAGKTSILQITNGDASTDPIKKEPVTIM